MPVFHSHLIANALMVNNSVEDIDLELVNEDEHRKMPLFLIKTEGYKLVQDYLKKVYLDSNLKKEGHETEKLVL